MTHFALSALRIFKDFYPRPMAQAITFRAFGAKNPSFHTGSELLGYCQSSAARTGRKLICKRHVGSACGTYRFFFPRGFALTGGAAGSGRGRSLSSGSGFTAPPGA
jgi:hypothetical protein